jgi:hypothetical protein
MDFLQTRRFTASLQSAVIHIGSSDQAEASTARAGRDFAAVLAQTAARDDVFSILSTYSMKYSWGDGHHMIRRESMP